MEMYIQGNILREDLMEKVNISGKMEITIKANLKMD